jgi:hypothetical protein
MYPPASNAVHKLPQKPVFPSWEDGRPGRDHPTVRTNFVSQPFVNAEIDAMFALILFSTPILEVLRLWSQWHPLLGGQFPSQLPNPLVHIPDSPSTTLIPLDLIPIYVGCVKMMHGDIARLINPPGTVLMNGGPAITNSTNTFDTNILDCSLTLSNMQLRKL